MSSIQQSTDPQAQYINVQLAWPRETKNMICFNAAEDPKEARFRAVPNLYVRKETLMQAFGEHLSELEVIIRRKRK